MNLLDSLHNLPIGILPGSVPDAPVVPPASAPKAAAERPLTGRELALQLAGHVRDIARGVWKLVELQESSTKRYLMSGSVAAGGTASTVPAPLLNANANRRGLSVQNIATTGTISLGLGTTAPQINTGITLAPGQSWDGRVSGQMFRGSISIVGSAAAVAYTSVEV